MRNHQLRLICILLLCSLAFAVLAISSGCAKKTGQVLHLSVLVQEKNGKTAGKTLTVTILIDNKEIAKGLPLSATSPINKDIPISNGLHSIKITENSTGTSTQGTFVADKDYWYRAVLKRETESIGYFDTRSQASPFKDTVPAVAPAGNNTGLSSTSGSSRHDDFDKQLKNLKNEARKKNVKTWGKIQKSKKTAPGKKTK